MKQSSLKPESSAKMAAILVPLVLLVGAFGGIWFVNLLAPGPDIIASERLVPVMIFRPNFLLGIIVAIIASGLGALASVLFVGKPIFHIAGVSIAFVATVVAVLLVLSSLIPEWGTLGGATTARTNPLVVKQEKVFALPLFFDRGSSKLRAEAKTSLYNSIAVFKSCSLGDVNIRGFASSRQFREGSDRRNDNCDSDCKNNGLANERAYAIYEHLRSLGVFALEPIPWTDADEMIMARRVRDIGPDSTLLPALEKLNQRGEVFWREGACGAQGKAADRQ